MIDAARADSIVGPRAWKHTLPPLPYDFAALEPYIDAQTLRLHHDEHHASYVAKLNSALEALPDLRGRSVQWLLSNLNEVPVGVRTSIRNNAGGHLNHSLYWESMAPASGGEPEGALADAINRDFGSLAQLEAQFADAGAELFGSGWVWLAKTRREGGKLRIFATAGHDNPLLRERLPVLVNDVWEHAYYLKYQNRRSEYLHAWWSLANWKEAARRFARSGDAADDAFAVSVV